MTDASPVTVVHAAFVAEARDVAQMPAGGPPEVAIAGRSNVGKSTLLNRIAGRKALARVSKTPGRTRGLVVFDLELRWRDAGTRESRRALPGDSPRGSLKEPSQGSFEDETAERLRLIDLPGYGYAQVSHAERRAWQVLVEGYVKQRDSLKLVLVLVDARRELGAEELQLMEWLQVMHVPCHLVITKADKLGAAERGILRERVRKENAAAGASVSLVSGATGEGLDALWSRIGHALKARKDDAEATAR